MTQLFCFQTPGLSIPMSLCLYSRQGCLPALRTCHPPPQQSSSPYLIAQFLHPSSLPLYPSPHTPSPLSLPVPHPGSRLRGEQPGTQRGTRIGSCLACSRSARGHTAVAHGGTRPRLQAPTRRLRLGQTLPLTPPTPALRGLREDGRWRGQGRSQTWARATLGREPGAAGEPGEGGKRAGERRGPDDDWGHGQGRGGERNGEGGNLGRAGRGQGQGRKGGYGDRTKGRQERGEGRDGVRTGGARVRQGGNRGSWSGDRLRLA